MAALKKAAILIPKPGHQVENVGFLAKAGAVVLVYEKTSDGNFLSRVIKELLADAQKRHEMGEALGKLLPVAGKQEILEVFKKLA